MERQSPQAWPQDVVDVPASGFVLSVIKYVVAGYGKAYLLNTVYNTYTVSKVFYVVIGFRISMIYNVKRTSLDLARCVHSENLSVDVKDRAKYCFLIRDPSRARRRRDPEIQSL
jgi:hypothetical protein